MGLQCDFIRLNGAGSHHLGAAIGRMHNSNAARNINSNVGSNSDGHSEAGKFRW